MDCTESYREINVLYNNVKEIEVNPKNYRSNH